MRRFLSAAALACVSVGAPAHAQDFDKVLHGEQPQTNCPTGQNFAVTYELVRGITGPIAMMRPRIVGVNCTEDATQRLFLRGISRGFRNGREFEEVLTLLREVEATALK